MSGSPAQRRRTWVKICGNTSLEDAQAAVEAGADAVGLVFAPSPRQISPDAGRRISAELPERVEKIGVFVNATQQRIREIVDLAGLTAVQLHGDESPQFALSLFAGPRRPKIFKALHAGAAIEDELRRFLAAGVDGILLDSGGRAGRARGGTGESFDWESARSWLPQVARQTRVVLAGGLSPENVAQAVRILEPWGVDVCSGVERCPGKKEHARMREFVAAVRGAKRDLVIS